MIREEYLKQIEQGLTRWHMVAADVVHGLIAEIRRLRLENAELRSNGALRVLRVNEAERD